jgi:hypothetical protein
MSGNVRILNALHKATTFTLFAITCAGKNFSDVNINKFQDGLTSFCCFVSFVEQ